MINTRYEYDPGTSSVWTLRSMARLTSPEWHEARTRSIEHNQGEGFSALVDYGTYPQWVTSPRGGLVHLVEFVTWSYVPATYGDSVIYQFVCGQWRRWDRCVPVPDPPEVCHKCHDRHWLKTGEHLPAIPQSGCELTGGTFFVTNRAQDVRRRAAEAGVTG